MKSVRLISFSCACSHSRPNCSVRLSPATLQRGRASQLRTVPVREIRMLRKATLGTWRPLRQTYQEGVPGLQRGPTAKPPCPTYSIFRGECLLSALDEAGRQLLPEGLVGAGSLEWPRPSRVCWLGSGAPVISSRLEPDVDSDVDSDVGSCPQSTDGRRWSLRGPRFVSFAS